MSFFQQALSRTKEQGYHHCPPVQNKVALFYNEAGNQLPKLQGASNLGAADKKEKAILEQFKKWYEVDGEGRENRLYPIGVGLKEDCPQALATQDVVPATNDFVKKLCTMQDNFCKLESKDQAEYYKLLLGNERLRGQKFQDTLKRYGTWKEELFMDYAKFLKWQEETADEPKKEKDAEAKEAKEGEGEEQGEAEGGEGDDSSEDEGAGGCCCGCCCCCIIILIVLLLAVGGFFGYWAMREVPPPEAGQPPPSTMDTIAAAAVGLFTCSDFMGEPEDHVADKEAALGSAVVEKNGVLVDQQGYPVSDPAYGGMRSMQSGLESTYIRGEEMDSTYIEPTGGKKSSKKTVKTESLTPRGSRVTETARATRTTDAEGFAKKDSKRESSKKDKPSGSAVVTDGVDANPGSPLRGTLIS
ncbi:unnamed protein product [Amoebophrya sp. A25]|nr:unnamed protein product [Amoebophrya sp. A25]|eukprot:GSA25T00017895001.1